jgi:addiction module HigA family antidote
MAKEKMLEPNVVVKNLIDEYQLPVNQVASDLKLSPSAIRQIISGRTKITTQVALRLAKYFNMTPEYWINIQNQYDLSVAQKDSELSGIIKNIQKAKKPAAKAKSKEPAKVAGKAKASAKPKAAPKPAKAAKEPAPKTAKPRKAVKK